MQLESAGGMSADLFVRRKIKEVVAHLRHGTAAPEWADPTQLLVEMREWRKSFHV